MSSPGINRKDSNFIPASLPDAQSPVKSPGQVKIGRQAESMGAAAKEVLNTGKSDNVKSAPRTKSNPEAEKTVMSPGTAEKMIGSVRGQRRAAVGNYSEAKLEAKAAAEVAAKELKEKVSKLEQNISTNIKLATELVKMCFRTDDEKYIKQAEKNISKLEEWIVRDIKAVRSLTGEENSTIGKGRRNAVGKASSSYETAFETKKAVERIQTFKKTLEICETRLDSFKSDLITNRELLNSKNELIEKGADGLDLKAANDSIDEAKENISRLEENIQRTTKDIVQLKEMLKTFEGRK